MLLLAHISVYMSIFSVHSKEANKPARFFTIPDLNLDLAGGSLEPCNQHDWTRAPPAWPAARLFPEESKNIGQNNQKQRVRVRAGLGTALGEIGNGGWLCICQSWPVLRNCSRRGLVQVSLHSTAETFDPDYNRMLQYATVQQSQSKLNSKHAGFSDSFSRDTNHSRPSHPNAELNQSSPKKENFPLESRHRTA